MRIFSLLATFLLLIVLGSSAQDLVPYAPKVVLMDFTSGRILYQKNSDAPNPPASLTKLMTLHLAWKALEDGRYKPDTIVPISEISTSKAMPRDSSLMFLEAGQIVTFKELMLGLAVDSGNDAGLTLALFLAGTETNFVEEMNREAKRLGLNQTTFFDSYGISALNTTTAKEYADLCRAYISAHPFAMNNLHAIREMIFPQSANWPEGHRGPVKSILQYNRNSLLFTYPGADGLKTGYIVESGYNIAATAVRGPQRLIAVVMGIKAQTTALGSKLRADAAKTLLDFGFTNFPLQELPTPELPIVKGWYVENETINLKPAHALHYPLNTDETNKLSYKIEVPKEVLGPFPADKQIGKIIWNLHGKVIAEQALVSREPVQEAGFWLKLWHSIVLFFSGLFGHKAPVDLASLKNM